MRAAPAPAAAGAADSLPAFRLEYLDLVDLRSVVLPRLDLPGTTRRLAGWLLAGDPCFDGLDAEGVEEWPREVVDGELRRERVQRAPWWRGTRHCKRGDAVQVRGEQMRSQRHGLLDRRPGSGRTAG
jgi:hypothetical protein